MIKKEKSIIYLCVIVGLLGFVILGLIKIIGSRYMSKSRIESSVLDSVVRLIDNTLADPNACLKTFSQTKFNYGPRSIARILSANGYEEFRVGNKLTQDFVIEKITAQYIDKSSREDLILLKLSFKNSKSKKQKSILKLFSMAKSKSKIVGCAQVQELRR